MAAKFARVETHEIGRCIYCGSTDQPSSEHVLPEALGGDVELKSGSCECCRIKIHRFETKFLSALLGPLRHGRGFATKTRKRKDGLPRGAWVTIVRPEGQREKRYVVANDLPKFSWKLPDYHYPPFAVFDLPLVERRPDARQIRMSIDHNDAAHQMRALGGIIDPECDEDAVCRSLAKMAHGVAVAALGLEGWEPLLCDYIIGGEPPGPIEEFIGASWAWQLHGEDELPETANPVVVSVTTLPLVDSRDHAVFGNIHILPNLGTTNLLPDERVPSYGVFVGKCSEEKLRSIRQ